MRPRSLARRSRQDTTPSASMERATSVARHSRVNSSMTLSSLMVRPSAVWSNWKSSARRNQRVTATSPDLGVLCDDHSPKFAGGPRCSDRGRSRRCQLPGSAGDDGCSGIDSAVQRPAVGGRSQVRSSLGPQAPPRSIHRAALEALSAGATQLEAAKMAGIGISTLGRCLRGDRVEMSHVRVRPARRSEPVRARRDQGRDRSW